MAKIDIQREKEAISSFIEKNLFKTLEKTKASLKAMIDANLKAGNLTQEEYKGLITYLEEKIEEKRQIMNKENNKIKKEKISNLESKEKKDNSEEENSRKKFCNEIKVQQEQLNFTPMYKGKWNELPPKTNNMKERE